MKKKFGKLTTAAAVAGAGAAVVLAKKASSGKKAAEKPGPESSAPASYRNTELGKHEKNRGERALHASFLEISIVCAGFGIPCRTRLKSHRDCSDGNPMAKRAKKDVLARRFKLKIPNLRFF